MYLPIIPRQATSVKRCGNDKCGKTLKNKKNYIPIVRVGKKDNFPVLHIDKRCVRCGEVTAT